MTRRIFHPRRPSAPRNGFTLVEMLIAMAITLVMIGAVVTLFANISNSVRNRRAVVELSGQMRHARNMLQQDLQGATCNGLVWQRPDENQGYIEIIEGPRREAQASVLVDADPDASPPRNWPPTPQNPEIDHTTSIIPSSNLPFNQDPNILKKTWLTDGGSLGDYDDILMLTVRNEHEPFVGRVPRTGDGSPVAVRPNENNATAFPQLEPTTVTSPLAEVIWYALENPDANTNDAAGNFFGEPGMRTIYRRALLIAPFLNPYRYVRANGTYDDTFSIPRDGATFTAKPGLLRVLPDDIAFDDVAGALACLVAFQERYDLSVRLEFDPLLGDAPGRWKIVANTLGDLTKRENRYEHHFYRPGSDPPRREYPFAMVAAGSDYEGTGVQVVLDREVQQDTSGPGPFRAGFANLDSFGTINQFVSSFRIDPDQTRPRPLRNRPFAYVSDNSSTLATARVMLNDEGQIIRILAGPVPLSGERRGEDVMLSDALGFDLRVYDPGAPLFAHTVTETVLQPTDPAWLDAYVSNDNMTNNNASPGRIGNASSTFPFVGQGAYVDLGYGFDARRASWPVAYQPTLPTPQFAAAFSSATQPWFFAARALSNVYGNELATGYAVFDTWSFHYENNGLNEDGDELETVNIGGVNYEVPQRDNGNGVGRPQIDEFADGLDSADSALTVLADGSRVPPSAFTLADAQIAGPDDVGEHETIPPYDKPLRGLQAVLRLYERDSRQVRQVSVNQSFVPE